MARMSGQAGSAFGSREGDKLQEALPPEMKAAPLRCTYQHSCRGDSWSFGTQCTRTLGSGGNPNSNCVPSVGLPHKRAHRHSSSCCGKELLGPMWVCRVPHPHHCTRVTGLSCSLHSPSTPPPLGRSFPICNWMALQVPASADVIFAPDVMVQDPPIPLCSYSVHEPATHNSPRDWARSSPPST